MPPECPAAAASRRASARIWRREPVGHAGDDPRLVASHDGRAARAGGQGFRIVKADPPAADPGMARDPADNPEQAFRRGCCTAFCARRGRFGPAGKIGAPIGIALHRSCPAADAPAGFARRPDRPAVGILQPESAARNGAADALGLPFRELERTRGRARGGLCGAMHREDWHRGPRPIPPTTARDEAPAAPRALVSVRRVAGACARKPARPRRSQVSGTPAMAVARAALATSRNRASASQRLVTSSAAPAARWASMSERPGAGASAGCGWPG